MAKGRAGKRPTVEERVNALERQVQGLAALTGWLTFVVVGKPASMVADDLIEGYRANEAARKAAQKARRGRRAS